MGLSFVVEGPCSGGLGRLDAHAATACLKTDFSKSETSKYLRHNTLNGEPLRSFGLWLRSCRVEPINSVFRGENFGRGRKASTTLFGTLKSWFDPIILRVTPVYSPRKIILNREMFTLTNSQA